MSIKQFCIISAGLYMAAALAAVMLSSGSLVHLTFSGLHAAFAISLVLPVVPGISRRFSSNPRFQHVYIATGELLLIAVGATVAFLYFYALNANLDYVQRFMEHTGRLQLALDTTRERTRVIVLYAPFLLAGSAFYVLSRLVLAQGTELGYRFRNQPDHVQPRYAQWMLPVILVSAAVTALSLPNGFFLQGVPLLAWFGIIPLFVIIDRMPFATAWRYGVTWGIAYLILTNYWLATFSLVSLQTAVLIYTGYYLLFFPVIILMRLISSRWRFFLMAAAFAVFDYIRSLGFLGYPWALIPHSQYRNPVIMQIAEFTGVWGIGFLIFLVNALGAQVYTAVIARDFTLVKLPIACCTILLVSTLTYGGITLYRTPEPSVQDTIRVALIQQNTDPRQANFQFTFGILRDLTHASMEHDPDLVVWGETAFVPNIRRWSDPDQPAGAYTGLVRRFLDFQQKIKTPLLTGNDDYTVVRDTAGDELYRNHFNAAVFFDAEGERLQAYHKIRLVPFTEYFPMGDLFPAAMELLEAYGVDFWEPGTEYMVFDAMEFSFATPICFEDIFPQEVRRFVQNGADVIINLTNDYWSLNPVQGEQHYAGSVFRAVENRRPVLRASVSGKTAYVDTYGRLRAELPYYERDYLVVDMNPEISTQYVTLYTAWGDWFPGLLIGILLAATVYWVLKTGTLKHRR